MNASTSTTVVDIVPDSADQYSGWVPNVGEETQNLPLPPEAKEQIVAEACRILSHCVDPNGPPRVQTGLVIGFVQSGKTTSFTTVAALSRDNGYRLVIVIAGTTTPLFEQNRERIIASLRLQSRPRSTPWRHVTQPQVSKQDHVAIRDTVALWNETSATPEERRTVLVTVMKHHQHLKSLTEVLSRVELANVPTLLIDDEGDQAGLNTQVKKGDESTTYRCLLELKSSLPLHSYLQYTATPQAPLLINLVDVLSPTFVEILTPGSGYVGGDDFFGPKRDKRLIRRIPEGEIGTKKKPLSAPPPTLMEAMLLFYAGVAFGYVRKQPEKNCSMLVHPSQLRESHKQFYGWVMSAKTEWLRTYRLPEDDPDRIELLGRFRSTYDGLCATLDNPPPFAEIESQLGRSISQTEVRELNTRANQRTPEIDWGQSYSWILVGGQAMDRGFTVEGLTVTYMPRSLGVGNADTVQQRARFFGYKRPYLGLCRIFMGTDAERAFRSYVEHEKDIHQELSRFSTTGRSLAEWRRGFFLNRELRPTRDNVIDVAYERVRLSDQWAYPEEAHVSPEAVVANRQLFNRFRTDHTFDRHDGLDLRKDSDRNLALSDISLEVIHQQLLTQFRVSTLEDSQILGAIQRLVQRRLILVKDDTCTVFLMSEGNRRRRSHEDGQIRELFQGVQYSTKGGQKQMTYPGDRKLLGTRGLTIQMSYLDLGPESALIAENIPHIAIYIPPEIGADMVLQPQGS